jgi:hypothetical protein
MAVNISGYGLQLFLQASFTFPTGFIVNQFADDADPFDVPTLTIGESAMGLNGDLITWAKANPIEITLNVVPNSVNDNNLQIILNQNRPGRGKLAIPDVIQLTAQFPVTSVFTAPGIYTYTNGIITSGMPGNSVSSAGRMKTKPYTFTFENVIFST